MIIDTHMHEKTYSLDSKLSLEDIVKRARKIGLDGVCITDHESNEIMEKAHEYSKETGFLIIVGAEILTHEGDITVFGLDRLPTEKLHAQQLIDMTLKAGGVAMSAHPFRNNN
jgi:Predicted metal-dependent phosphoesterases (PHP family)